MRFTDVAPVENARHRPRPHQIQRSSRPENREISTAERSPKFINVTDVDGASFRYLKDLRIHELEGSGKERDITKWGQFTDASHIQAEMLKRLDEHFEKWLNPE